MSQLKIKNGNNWESIPAGGIGVPSGGTTGQVLQKSSNTDYATEWASKGITLLWTNPNPTSAFAAQTVSLDLSGYDAVNVIIITNGAYLSSIAMVGDIGIVLFGSPNTNANGGRKYTVNSNGIAFDACVYNNATNNGLGIPIKIYGIKF